jgi:hypothetical protein
MKIKYLQDFAIIEDNGSFIVIDTLIDVSNTFTTLTQALDYIESEFPSRTAEVA